MSEKSNNHSLHVTVVGAGILGLWQAFELVRRGHQVTLFEAMSEAETGAASRIAGAMLAPYCEAEAAEPLVRDLGVAGLALWKEAYPDVVQRGSLVMALPRDQGELTRFSRMTQGHRLIDGNELGTLENDLNGRFARALYFETEAHVSPRRALAFLVAELRRFGADVRFGEAIPDPIWRAAGAGECVIDCRGMASRHGLDDLRGVRGEMAVVRASDVSLARPVRLLHPRFPIYVVPWGDDLYMIGATMIERDDAGPVTVRSALDLLGTAYSLHPAFGEAEIVELSAGVRPAFADNIPRIVLQGRRISVNGAFRHGYLLAPMLAQLTANYLETGDASHPTFLRR